MKKLIFRYKLTIKAKMFAYSRFGRWVINNKDVWKSMNYKEQKHIAELKVRSYELTYLIKKVLKDLDKYESLT